jgi:hypothetical protein
LAADQNYAPAQNRYAISLAQGRGVGVDPIYAEKQFKLAMDQNPACVTLVSGQFHYGLCAEESRRTPSNLLDSAIQAEFLVGAPASTDGKQKAPVIDFGLGPVVGSIMIKNQIR